MGGFGQDSKHSMGDACGSGVRLSSASLMSSISLASLTYISMFCKESNAVMIFVIVLM